jgi:putative membrane protein
LTHPVWLYLKGIAMGAADAVPGVSGGTIAFISGIYEELVESIRSFNGNALKLLARREFTGFWHHINGTFLCVLLAGIGTSLVLLSRIILYWLVHYPEILWAFFFGLIVASALMVGRKISRWKGLVVLSVLLGTAFGYAVTVITPAETPVTAAFVFLSGMIAICAMILPGISGSFILLLLGKYEYVLGALRDFHLSVILIFGTGAAVGILSFSHLLHWLLRRFHDLTVAFLTGIMIGSLNKVWPWKETIETFTSPSGKVKPLVTRNMLPFDYLEVVGREPYLVPALLLALFGFGLVMVLERMSGGVGPDETTRKEGAAEGAAQRTAR